MNYYQWLHLLKRNEHPMTVIEHGNYLLGIKLVRSLMSTFIKLRVVYAYGYLWYINKKRDDEVAV